MNASDINVFEKSTRAGNDAANRIREKILTSLLTSAATPFCADPDLGPRWTSRRNAWRTALLRVASQTAVGPVGSIEVKHLGGQKNNHDFLVSFKHADSVQERKVEYKFSPGGKGDITSLPQILDLYADIPLVAGNYPSDFYDQDLDRLIQLGGVSPSLKPTKEAYLKLCRTDTRKKQPFFQALYEADKARKGNKELEAARDAIVYASITRFLEANLGSVNLERISEELQRTQANKNILIDNGSTFSFDTVHPEELKIVSVIGLSKQKNCILVQSAAPGTFYSMRLRWKNRKGVNTPAWQIKIHRGAAAAVDESDSDEE